MKRFFQIVGYLILCVLKFAFYAIVFGLVAGLFGALGWFVFAPHKPDAPSLLERIGVSTGFMYGWRTGVFGAAIFEVYDFFTWLAESASKKLRPVSRQPKLNISLSDFFVGGQKAAPYHRPATASESFESDSDSDDHSSPSDPVTSAEDYSEQRHDDVESEDDAEDTDKYRRKADIDKCEDCKGDQNHWLYGDIGDGVCSECDGVGHPPFMEDEPCHVCDGSGKCPSCDGKGFTYKY